MQHVINCRIIIIAAPVSWLKSAFNLLGLCYNLFSHSATIHISKIFMRHNVGLCLLQHRKTFCWRLAFIRRQSSYPSASSRDWRLYKTWHAFIGEFCYHHCSNTVGQMTGEGVHLKHDANLLLTQYASATTKFQSYKKEQQGVK